MPNPITGAHLYKEDGTLDRLIGDLGRTKQGIKETEDAAKLLRKALSGFNSKTSAGKSAIASTGNEVSILAAKMKKLKIAESETGQQIAVLNQQIKKQRRSNQEAAGAFDKVSAAVKKYEISLDKSTAEAAQYNQLTREQTRINKANAAETLAGAGAYNQISAALAKADIRLKNMSKSQREGTAAGRRLEGRVKSLRAELTRLDARTGVHTRTVGKYERAVNGAAGAARRWAGTLIGFAALERLNSSLFSTARELDSVEFAFSKVVKGQDDQTKSLAFLNDITERYGLEILGVTQAYTKFRAATSSTNLSVQETNKIFESFSKVSGVLGLRADQTREVFLALEQIMSKGNVSSEELRRQLGEKIPGAFNIMASVIKNANGTLGVTVSELTDMLKAGEVVSEEVMPRFAEAVEKSLGVDGLRTVQNLNSEVNKFSNDWVKLTKAIEASDAYEQVFILLRQILAVVTNNLKAIGLFAKGIGVLVAAMLTWKAVTIAQNSLLGQLILRQNGAAIAARLLSISIGKVRKAILLMNAALFLNPLGLLVVSIVAVTGAAVVLSKELDEVAKSQRRMDKATKDVGKRIEEEKDRVNDLFEAYKDLNNPFDVRRKALEKLQRQYPEYLENLDLEKSSLEDIAAAQQTVNIAIRKGNADKIRSERERAVQLQEEAQKRLDELKAGDNAGFFETVSRGNITFEQDSENKLLIEDLTNDISSLEQQILQADEALSGLFGNRGGGRGANAATIESLFGKTPDPAGPKDKPKAKKETFDPFKQRELEIAALEDGLIKEELLLQLSFDKRAKDYEKYKVSEALVAEFYNRELSEIRKKFRDEDIERAISAEELRLSLLEDGIDKTIALLEVEKERKIFEENATGERELEIIKFYQGEKAKALAEDAEERKKEAEKINQELQDNEFALFEKSEALRKQLFLTERKRTAEEIEKFELDAERRLIKKKLEINAIALKKLSGIEIDTLNARIAEIDRLISEVGEGKDRGSLLEQLGFSLKDKDGNDITEVFAKSIESAFSFAAKQLKEFQAERVKVAEENVKTSKNAVTQAQRDLANEIKKDEAGLASSVKTAELKVENEKALQKKALAEQEEAKKQQEKINTALEASNLAVAITKIFASVAFPFSLIASGVMLSAFIGAKAKAANLSRREFAEGGYDVLEGGSHQSGDDVYIGQGSQGTADYGEGGEGRAIFNKAATNKYKNELPRLTDMINAGKLEKYTMRGNINSSKTTVVGNNVDTSRMESHLKKIAKNTEKEVLISGDTIITKKGNTIEYVSIQS